MTVITSTTSNQASQALLDSVNGSGAANDSSIDDIQDRFMTLLVTQMRNQDPLNPMDNAQVTSQMAQLSTVTGVDKLNNSLESLINSFQASQSYQASSMIGHHVLIEGNQVETDGTGGFFGIELPVGADNLEINIKDAQGNTVRSLSFDNQLAGTVPLSWDGYTSEGAVADNGYYTIEASATVNNQTVEATPLTYAQVLSVSNASDGVKLNLSNAESVNTSDVKEIY